MILYSQDASGNLCTFQMRPHPPPCFYCKAPSPEAPPCLLPRPFTVFINPHLILLQRFTERAAHPLSWAKETTTCKHPQDSDAARQPYKCQHGGNEASVTRCCSLPVPDPEEWQLASMEKLRSSHQFPQRCPEERCKNRLSQSKWQGGGTVAGSKAPALSNGPLRQVKHNPVVTSKACAGDNATYSVVYQLHSNLRQDDLRQDGLTSQGTSGHSHRSDLYNPGPV